MISFLFSQQLDLSHNILFEGKFLNHKKFFRTVCRLDNSSSLSPIRLNELTLDRGLINSVSEAAPAEMQLWTEY